MIIRRSSKRVKLVYALLHPTTFATSLRKPQKQKMSTSSLTLRLLARPGTYGLRPAVCELARHAWRFYSPKGAQLPVVEEKRQRALQGGGEKRVQKLHKTVSTVQ